MAKRRKKYRKHVNKRPGNRTDKLRAWKSRAHTAFDPLWRKGPMSRDEAYLWLGKVMGVKGEAHIRNFNIDQCRRAVAVCMKRQEAFRDGKGNL